MAEEKWFHGRTSRQKAEDLLHTSGIDGSFVVRASESIKGAYALSLLFHNTVHTYRILPTENEMLAVQTLTGVQQRKFSTISELVNEYKNPNNGLVCGLTVPVGATDFKLQSLLESAAPSSLVPGMPTRPPQSPSAQPSIKTTALPLPAPPADKVVNRELPPVPGVPIRDSPQTPPILLTGPAKKANQQSLESGNVKDLEIQTKLHARLMEMQNMCTGVNQAFMDEVQHYINSTNGLSSDILTVRGGGGQCAQLQKLLAKESVTFQRELEGFLMKTDILRQLFDLTMHPHLEQPRHNAKNNDVDLDTFLGRLADCNKIIKSLNRQACVNIQDGLGIAGAMMARTPIRKFTRTVKPLKERTFDVKVDGLIGNRQKLKVDMNKGTLTIIKIDGGGLLEYDHTQVLQIVKNNKSKTKLCIVAGQGGKKRDYVFDEAAQRETFCQLMQHIRNVRMAQAEPDCVSVFCGTWNMGDAIPPPDISSWLLCAGSGRTLDPSVQAIPHDVYAIGTQETGLPEKEWMHRVIDTTQDLTGVNFHVVAMDALWHIKILILVKDEHKHRISHIKTSSVKTGIANALGNKGAVGVSFQFGGTSFCFINAHLTSGNEKCVRRNNNFHDIMRSLNLGDDRFRQFDLSNRFDHLYFIGDLNYRLELDVHEILTHTKKKDFAHLLIADQLKREQDSNKAFCGFLEDEICFPPTYRYERGTRDAYCHLKVKKTGIRVNVPSWCDRVLWKSYPEAHSVCLAYGCSDDIMTSDHSPVFANFQVGVRGQYVSNEGISSNPSGISASIHFETIEINLRAPGRSSFYLEFHSNCLTGPVRGDRNNKFDTACDVGGGATCNFVHLTWYSCNLPQLQPIIADREFLVDQHLLVMVRAEDDGEASAECVLALRSVIASDPQKFEERLKRKGDDVGSIKGKMHVRARGDEVREKTYDFIQIGAGLTDADNKRNKPDDITTASTPSLPQPLVSPPANLQLGHPRSPSPTFTQHQPSSHSVLVKQKPMEVGLYGGDAELVSDGDVGYADPTVIRTALSSLNPVDNPSTDTSRAYVNSKLVKPGASPKLRVSPTRLSASSSAATLQSLGPTSSPASNMVRQQLERWDDNCSTQISIASRNTPGEDAPSSVDQLLSELGMNHYTKSLKESGWDTVEFLSDITHDDLILAGVINRQDRIVILRRVHQLS